ncbi:MAG: nucleotidyltransferase domain-containing protein [Acidobacteriota bacterium]
MTADGRRGTLPETTSPVVRAALTAALSAWTELLGPRLVSLVLFGSVARGDAGASSDIDVLVVADGMPHGLADRARPLRQAWQRVRADHGLPAIEWNLVVKTPAEASHHSPLYLDMVEDAILLADRSGFFAGVLEAMRARMASLGSRRVHLPDGTWYWDLKPDYRFGEIVEI